MVMAKETVGNRLHSPILRTITFVSIFTTFDKLTNHSLALCIKM